MTKQVRQAITPTHVLGSTGTAEGDNLGFQSKADFVVGTVSQSGGVPTGAIIERGSNANGEYIRLADGTQICWLQSFEMVFVADSAAEATWTFPIAFTVASAHIDATLSYGAGTLGQRFNRIIASGAGLRSTGGFVSARVYDDTNITGSIFLNVRAIGRWY